MDVRSQSRDELLTRFREWNQPAYRVDQLLRWLYVQRVSAWDRMVNLPAALREQLSAAYELHALELVRKQGANDATQKFLWRLKDGAMIESVLIPANPALYGDASDRHTLCVSTQVGCAYGCRFCASGLDGWKRNLEVEEIVEQVLAVERWHAGRLQGRQHEPERPLREPDCPHPGPLPSDGRGGMASSVDGNSRPDRLVNNLVIMGMGEPLANYEHLLKALTILNAPWGGNIGARKITISTSGLAPQIRRLADQPYQFRLAISLHGATNPVRESLMPVNRKYPLEELMAACEYYRARKGQVITFEYILIAGANDAKADATALAELATKLRAKVNLIPYNQVEGLDWQRPAESVMEAFAENVTRAGVTATLRREKGHDIDAACGQLRLRTEKELGPLKTA